MATLEELTRGASVAGVVPERAVTVKDVKWLESATIELTYVDDEKGAVSSRLLHRTDEANLRVVERPVVGLASLTDEELSDMMGGILVVANAPDEEVNDLCEGAFMHLMTAKGIVVDPETLPKHPAAWSSAATRRCSREALPLQSLPLNRRGHSHMAKYAVIPSEAARRAVQSRDLSCCFCDKKGPSTTPRSARLRSG